jgi:hypothetical protein
MDPETRVGWHAATPLIHGGQIGNEGPPSPEGRTRGGVVADGVR